MGQVAFSIQFFLENAHFHSMDIRGKRGLRYIHMNTLLNLGPSTVVAYLLPFKLIICNASSHVNQFLLLGLTAGCKFLLQYLFPP